MLSLTSPVETPYHRIPTPLKFAALALATLGLFLAPQLWVQALAMAGVGALYAVGGRHFLSEGWRNLRPLLWLVLVLAAWHGITGAWAEGALIVLRMVTLVALATLVTMTTRLDDVIGLVTRLTRPLRALGLKSGAVELAVALVIRFTPVLKDKADALREAWRARSARRPGWKLLGPLLLAAVDDADHVAEALRARGGVPEGE